MAGSATLRDLDGPVAAPGHHEVVFENAQVRVVRTVIEAGDTVPLHTHLRPHLTIVLGGGHWVRRDADGVAVVDTRVEGLPASLPAYRWTDGTPAHTLENLGDDRIELLSVELKRDDARR